LKGRAKQLREQSRQRVVIAKPGEPIDLAPSEKAP
jgi:DNA-directed RNA polymerase subunit K/omega